MEEPTARGPDITPAQVEEWRVFRAYLADWTEAIEEWWSRLADEAASAYFRERRETAGRADDRGGG